MVLTVALLRWYVMYVYVREHRYGFPEFKNISGEGNGEQLTITAEEALQRPIYTAFASRKIDVGNP